MNGAPKLSWRRNDCAQAGSVSAPQAGASAAIAPSAVIAAYAAAGARDQLVDQPSACHAKPVRSASMRDSCAGRTFW